jgi:hypothetical protein
MNQPPNGKWSYWLTGNDGNQYRYFWNGTQYIYAGDIVSGEDAAFMANPDYVNSFGNFELDIEQLTGVEVVASKIKKLLSSETYNTPQKRTNAVYVAVAISAIVIGLLVYLKKIKI